MVLDLEENYLGSIHSSAVFLPIKLASLDLSFFINKTKEGSLPGPQSVKGLPSA